MDGPETLPNRTEVGSKKFSPWPDRLALVSLSVTAVFAAPLISSSMEGFLGDQSMTATICGFLILIPVLATSFGKIYVRIKA
jgi:hypothetical protein